MSNSNISERREINGTTFIKKWIWCGKKTCKKCTTAKAQDYPKAPHGPYWYYQAGLWNGKPIWRYAGKNLPERFLVEGPDLFGRGKLVIKDSSSDQDSKKGT